MTKVRVLSVSQVDVHLQKSNPPTLGVVATGTAPSSGWTDPSLEAWRYVLPPDDGIQDFDFVAQPPAGIVLPVVLPITGEVSSVVDVLNYWGPGKPLAGVRIHARSNSMEARLSDAAAFSGDLLPAAWKGLAEAGSDSNLIGKTLRVYHTGDPLTLDLRPNRANVELGAEERIVRVWFG